MTVTLPFGDMEKFKNIAKIVAYLLMAGAAYGALKSDVNSIKENITDKVGSADRIHTDHETRIRSVEEDRSGLKKDVEYMKQSLDRIEKKLDRR